MTMVCEICQAFTHLSAQNILDHYLGCKARCDKDFAESEGHMKAPKKKKSRGKRKYPSHTVLMLPRSHKEQIATLHPPSGQANDHKSVHLLDHS